MKIIVITPSINHLFNEIDLLRTKELITELNNSGIETKEIPLNLFFDSDIEIINNKDYEYIIAINSFYTFNILLNKNFHNCNKKIICLWDNPFEGLLKLYEANKNQDENAIHFFKEICNLENIIHFSSDPKHTDILNSLGILDKKKVNEFNYFTQKNFINQGNLKTIKEVELSYFGNINLENFYENNFWKTLHFRKLTEKIIENKLSNLSISNWDILNKTLEENLNIKNKFNLEYNNKLFWDYLNYFNNNAINGLLRFKLLSNINREINVYGLFINPKTKDLLTKNLIYSGNIEYKNLPNYYSKSKISICISNGLIESGLQSKFLESTSSGCFTLSDHKEELINIFGNNAQKIIFNNKEELNNKIEYYIKNESERNEINEYFRSIIQKECSTKTLVSNILNRINEE
jgi:spore maturation protein CgeB